jgi:nucleoside-diphosphate-sugar epimerase
VYGVGRDQGLTSEPTKAMLAAAAGKPFHISFGGSMQFHFASDVALYFIEAVKTKVAGAYIFNIGGTPTSVSTFIELIQRIRPKAQITSSEVNLPFPDGADAGELSVLLPDTRSTPLADGIQSTIEHFELCLARGLTPI